MSIIQVRQKSVWLWPELVFKMTKDGQQFEKDLKILHDFTRYFQQLTHFASVFMFYSRDVIFELTPQGQLSLQGTFGV